MTKELNLTAGPSLVFLEVVGLRVNLACLIATTVHLWTIIPHHA